jgi:hypothetical protein
MPGFLIPADLDRLIPQGADPFTWAYRNLLASPGALVMKDGRTFRIHTLVPAVKPDGSCINLANDGLCTIHENAPFGCAFFSCGPEIPGMSQRGMYAVYSAAEDSLYNRLWRHLDARGKRQKSPDILRRRMAEEMNRNGNI